MKKKIVVILSLMVMLTAVFVFAGCDKPNTNSDTETDSNKENSSYAGIGSRSHFAGCVLDAGGYDIDNVTFEVYFGSMFGAGAGPELDMEYATKRRHGGFEYAEIWFYPVIDVGSGYTAGEDEYFIRRIDDYFSTEYWCSSSAASSLSKEAFHHHETVTVPKELLVGDSGIFGFQVTAKPFNPTLWYPETSYLGFLNIDYKIINGKVYLTSNDEMRN